MRKYCCHVKLLPRFAARESESLQCRTSATLRLFVLQSFYEFPITPPRPKAEQGIVHIPTPSSQLRAEFLEMRPCVVVGLSYQEQALSPLLDTAPFDSIVRASSLLSTSCEGRRCARRFSVGRRPSKGWRLLDITRQSINLCLLTFQGRQMRGGYPVALNASNSRHAVFT